MAKFSLVNSNIFCLPGTNNQWLHLGTVNHGLREYICIVYTVTNQCYIEEITGGTLRVIEDDALFNDLTNFLNEKGITDMVQVAQWLSHQKVDVMQSVQKR